ncbi:Suppressor of Gene Silencing 3 protein [Nymphaea thermarum]|nr:Suppressor of Gene Silencing 3 protein [Nymphaea thermarum]
MAGKSSSHKVSSSPSSSGHRKSRWDGNNPSAEKSTAEPKPSKEDVARSPAAAAAGPSKLPVNPSPPPSSGGLPLSLQDAGPGGGGGFPVPPPAPAYGFHMLERRTIVLADGSVRSYFALPPDYPLHRSVPDLPPGRPPADDRLYPYGPPHPGLGDPRGLDRIGMDKPFPPRFSPERFDSGFPRERDREDYRNLDNSLKRKYGEDDAGFGDPDRFYGLRFRDEEIARQRHQQILQYGNPNGLPGFSGNPLIPSSGRVMDELRMPKVQRHGDIHGGPNEGEGKNSLEVILDVDKVALRKAFLRLTKVLNENVAQRKLYLDDGKSGPVRCVVCGRTSKEFTDVHCLIMHAFNAQNPDLRIDHLGLHKALCSLMGWSYKKQPENSKIYQSLSAEDAAANRDDLVIWPPLVIIQNTNTGRRKDGRMDGMGNKEMDIKLKELGFSGGKSKSMYGKDGHLGITLVKFAATPAGLKECEHLAEFFEKDNHGRRAWARVQASSSSDDDKNPDLVKVDERTGEKKRVLYGYIGTAFDLEKVDFDLRKKALIKSRRDFDPSD